MNDNEIYYGINIIKYIFVRKISSGYTGIFTQYIYNLCCGNLRAELEARSYCH